MVQFSLAGSTICIDRYEASQSGGLPASVVNVQPWVNITPVQAEAACRLVGKRLCTEAEWQAACGGASNFAFPYGNAYNSTACNGLDLGRNSIGNTGSFSACQGGYPGLWDMSGNVYEFATNGAVIRAKGGSFRSGSGSGLLRCNTGFDWTSGGPDAVVGFRCCRNRDP